MIAYDYIATTALGKTAAYHACLMINEPLLLKCFTFYNQTYRAPTKREPL